MAKQFQNTVLKGKLHITVNFFLRMFKKELFPSQLYFEIFWPRAFSCRGNETLLFVIKTFFTEKSIKFTKTVKIHEHRCNQKFKN